MVTYADRPWTKNYDPGVPASLEPYPNISVHSFLQEAAKKSPDNAALISSAHLPVLGRVSSSVSYQALDQYSDADMMTVSVPAVGSVANYNINIQCSDPSANLQGSLILKTN